MGPFDGTVLDAEGDRAIADAMVVGTWVFERGTGFVGPDGAITRVSATGGDGTYSVPRLSDLPGGLSTRLAAFRITIYKRGYIAYRSDRYFSDGARRSDFAQHGAEIRLERIPTHFSHARHLAFLAGATALRSVSAWEIELANEERTAPKAVAKASPAQEAATNAPLDVWPLLSADDVRGVTGYTGAFEDERLTDLPRTVFYDSHHLRASGKPEKFDVALRAWKLAPDAAMAQYLKLATTLPGATTKDEIGTHSLRAGEGDILAVAFVDQPRGVVVQLSCGRGQCPNHEALVKLAQIALGRLDKLVPGQTEPPEPGPLKLKPPQL
jgi:hypothetical protein